MTSPGFRIRTVNRGDIPGLQVFVSKYTNDNGDNSWFNVDFLYDDPKKSHWSRKAGFETVIFRDQYGKSRAYWLQVVDGQTTDVTFYGMKKEISITYSKVKLQLVTS